MCACVHKRQASHNATTSVLEGMGEEGGISLNICLRRGGGGGVSLNVCLRRGRGDQFKHLS